MSISCRNTHPLLAEPLEPLRLALLLLVLLDLAHHAAPLREVERRVLRGALEPVPRLVIVARELQRPGDLVDEARELLRGLRRDGLDVALEDEEVLRLDEDVVLDECGVVRRVCDHSVVQLVFRRAGGGDSEREELATIVCAQMSFARARTRS